MTDQTGLPLWRMARYVIIIMINNNNNKLITFVIAPDPQLFVALYNI